MLQVSVRHIQFEAKRFDDEAHGKPLRHRQVAGAGMTKGALGRATGGDTSNYVATETLVTSAQVVNA
jgi:hypothetical protein